MPEPKGNAVQQAQALGQSIWFDSISRDLIRSGGLQRLVDTGITGVTSNPTIFEKAVAEGASYDEALTRQVNGNGVAEKVFESLAVEDIREAADVLRPVYERTDGADGFVSIEVSPLLARDAAGTVDEACRLFEAIGRPNTMIKVPGTPEGMPAVYSLASCGINVNVTLLFSLSAYRQSARAYIEGLQDYLRGGGKSISRVASVASFFVSRLDTAVDGLLDESVTQGGAADPAALKGKTAIASAKLAYSEFQSIFTSESFSKLRDEGARVQRPLWASTSAKNPAYPPTLYVDALVGPDTVNTLPPATLDAFLGRNEASATLTQNLDDARVQMEALAGLGIVLGDVTDRLLTDGLKAFEDSYQNVLDQVKQKRAMLLGADPTREVG